MATKEKSTDKYADIYPIDVRFDLVGEYVNPYVYKDTNIPVHNIKGDKEYPNMYERLNEKGETTIYRYLHGVSTIVYDEQVKLKYPTIEDARKRLRSPLDTIKFAKRFLAFNRLRDPSLFEFLLNSPNEETQAKELGDTPMFVLSVPQVKAKKQLSELDLEDKAIAIVKKIYENEDRTQFSGLCAFFNIDSNSSPDEKYLALRQKAKSAPDLIIKAIASIEGSNKELVEFGLQMGILIQTKTGFSTGDGQTEIKKYALTEKLDAQTMKEKFSRWLSTEDGETHKQWLKREMKAEAEKKTAEMMA